MSHARGTFWAKPSVPMLAYLRVRCASVLAPHPKLHSRASLINSDNLTAGAR